MEITGKKPNHKYSSNGGSSRVIGRIWSKSDGSGDGYIDFGFIGRIHIEVQENMKGSREGASDFVIKVATADMPLNQIRETNRQVEKALYEDVEL